jgi:hypothetical protein
MQGAKPTATIRGIGARTPFGTTRIKTYLDNIRLPMQRVNQVLKILIETMVKFKS